MPTRLRLFDNAALQIRDAKLFDRNRVFFIEPRFNRIVTIGIVGRGGGQGFAADGLSDFGVFNKRLFRL